jgi:hypothetical protein
MFLRNAATDLPDYTAPYSYLTSLLFNNATSTADAIIINDMFTYGSFNDIVSADGRRQRAVEAMGL